MAVSALPPQAPSVERTFQASKPKKLRPNLMLILALVVLFQIAAVAVVEAILYLAAIGEEHITLWDEQLGFRHRSNKRVTWRREGYSQSYFGADGLRQPGVAFQKKPGTYRVALIGDSLLEGLQEPLEHTFASRLEKNIKAKLNRPVEVINFGVFAYSTVQEALYLEEVLKKYGPDLVVLCYNTRDMAETLETWAPAGMQARGQRPYAIKSEGEPLKISNEPVVNAAADSRARLWESLNWVRQNSRIVGFIAENKPSVSLHNPLVEGCAAFISNPSRGLASIFMPESKSPSFQIKFFEDSEQANARSDNEVAGDQEIATDKKIGTDQKIATHKETAHDADAKSDAKEEGHRQPSEEQANLKEQPAKHLQHPQVKIAASSYSQTNNISFVKSTTEDGQRQYYLRTLDDTFGALLEKMNGDCKKAGAKLAVAIMPWRSDLLPTKAGGMPPSPFGVAFTDEVAFVSRNCEEKQVPFYDCHQEASKRSASEIKNMFFVFHLTRIGHQFIADKLLDFMVDQIATGTASSSRALQ